MHCRKAAEKGNAVDRQGSPDNPISPVKQPAPPRPRAPLHQAQALAGNRDDQRVAQEVRHRQLAFHIATLLP